MASIFLLMGFSLLIGIAILVLAVKRVEKGLLRKFLLTAGASLAGFPVFAVMHNLVYGLCIYFFGGDLWTRAGIEEEPFFFILAILVCPLGAVVGAAGSIVLAIKHLRSRQPIG